MYSWKRRFPILRRSLSYPFISSLHYFCLLPDMYYRIGTLRFDFVRRAEGMRPTMFAAMNSLTNALVTEDTAVVARVSRRAG